MNTLVLERPAETAEPVRDWQCDVHGCPKAAAAVVIFKGTEEWHTHECSQHLAESREWFDVFRVLPLPCTLNHSKKFVGAPPELE